MIISDKYKYVFIEIPFTGCTSVRRLLREQYDGRPVLHKHATYAELLRSRLCRRDDYRIFATVRNPLDTAVTIYEKRLSNHKGRYTDPQRIGTHSVPMRVKRQFDMLQRGHVDFYSFLKALQPHPYNNFYLLQHSQFDHIMRFERLNDDLATVLAKIGADTSAELPHTNRTANKRPFETYYCDRSVQHAIRVYGPYMRYWNYAFPESWGHIDVPGMSHIRFRTVDWLATAAASCFGMAPNSHGPVVGALRNALRTAWG